MSAQQRRSHRASVSSEAEEDLLRMDAQAEYIKQAMKWTIDDLSNTINYFRERMEIEDSYQKALDRLAAKQPLPGIIDGTLGSSQPVPQGSNPLPPAEYHQFTKLETTNRAAWQQLVEYTRNLSWMRSDLIGNLKVEQEILTQFKTSLEETRRTVKTQLKDNNDAYRDMRLQVLPKLQRQYELKCRELDAALTNLNQVTGHANSQSASLTNLSASSPATTSSEHSADTRFSQEFQRGSESLSPQMPPPKPTQPDKRIDKFMSKVVSMSSQLSQSAAAAGGGVGVNDAQKQNVRVAKIKKEVAEADSDYRKAIQKLEDLRLIQASVMETGLQMMDSSMTEKSGRTKKSHENWIRSEMQLIGLQQQSTEAMSAWVDVMAPTADTDVFKERFRRARSHRLAPIYYRNYFSGDCKDMIFGIPLTDYARTHKRTVPLIVLKCIHFVESMGGLDREGLYRISGRQATTDKLKLDFERDEEGLVFGENGVTDDVMAVANILKVYLRELPEPLFPFSIEARSKYSHIDDENARVAALEQKLSSLPDAKIDTLNVISEHLKNVIRHSSQNKMNMSNLSIVFAPAIFQDHLTAGTAVEYMHDRVFDDLIMNHDRLFRKIDITSLLTTVPPFSRLAAVPPMPAGPAPMVFKSAGLPRNNSTIPSSNSATLNRVASLHMGHNTVPARQSSLKRTGSIRKDFMSPRRDEVRRSLENNAFRNPALDGNPDMPWLNALTPTGHEDPRGLQPIFPASAPYNGLTTPSAYYGPPPLDPVQGHSGQFSAGHQSKPSDGSVVSLTQAFSGGLNIEGHEPIVHSTSLALQAPFTPSEIPGPEESGKPSTNGPPQDNNSFPRPVAKRQASLRHAAQVFSYNTAAVPPLPQHPSHPQIQVELPSQPEAPVPGSNSTAVKRPNPRTSSRLIEPGSALNLNEVKIDGQYRPNMNLGSTHVEQDHSSKTAVPADAPPTSPSQTSGAPQLPEIASISPRSSNTIDRDDQEVAAGLMEEMWAELEKDHSNA
ncbi:hypothetical protein BZG36_03854 [Bifiguratus adelaidae]|uniref:Rho-GAP domain-containing protein n=1 Tax=Bifiguratus adelaidae TaxID=1938954 RepID=A0A261XWG7_9FUNG|nr:hypothetical protein BZG36_03854 [Bifiguratus adelaidae]